MQRTRLFRTTAFRASLLLACLFSLLAAGGMGFIYWSTADYIETQIDARLQLETEVLLNLYRDQAMPALAETIRQRSRDDGQRKIFFYRLFGSNSRQAANLPSELTRAERAFVTVKLGAVFNLPDAHGSGDVPVRVLAIRLPNGQRLLVGRDLNDERELLDHTLSVVIAVILITFLLSMLGSAAMGYRALRRIDAVSQTAGEIMAGDLSQRIPVTERDDEFDLLGRKLNAMLTRIEQLMIGMRQVTDNIAHDLRSPLNRLRNRLDVTLLEARNEDEYRAVMEQAIVDADELLKTFSALLNIAQAEAGVNRNDWTALDLAALAEDMADLYGAVAEEKNIEWLYAAEPDVRIRGNRQLLAQAVGNLLDNAVKYTPTGGRISLNVRHQGAEIVLSVADNGPGIPENQRERVLERFVRLDDARSLPGNGLGLSLAKAVAKLHGARLVLADNNPGLCASLHFSSELVS